MTKEATIYEAAIKLVQDEDTCGRATTDVQELNVKLIDSTGNGEYYIVLETKRWAIDIDEIDAFAEGLKRYVKSIESMNPKKVEEDD